MIRKLLIFIVLVLLLVSCDPASYYFNKNDYIEKIEFIELVKYNNDSFEMVDASKISLKFDYSKAEKIEILDEFMGNYKEYSYVDKRTNNTYYTIRGNTKSHKVFNEIYNILYIDGVKTITYKYLDMIDHPIALAYWFMDDGTNRGQIATHCFSLNEVNILSDWLKNKFDINTTVQKQLNNYVLYITAYSREKFDKLIYPYVVPSMRYKLKFSELEESVNPVNSGEAR